MIIIWYIYKEIATQYSIWHSIRYLLRYLTRILQHYIVCDVACDIYYHHLVLWYSTRILQHYSVCDIACDVYSSYDILQGYSNTILYVTTQAISVTISGQISHVNIVMWYYRYLSSISAILHVISQYDIEVRFLTRYLVQYLTWTDQISSERAQGIKPHADCRDQCSEWQLWSSYRRPFVQCCRDP